ncbi:MAG: FAD-binding protein [Trueperaceae bacterium]|nr:FAD-binding protein [Trueperaceae bacterium]
MKQAIVIGASMGGLLAARVLTDHFDKVTIIERDSLPQAAENRKGVPQGRHAHGLLAAGANALGQLFPGFKDDLVAGGALPGDPSREMGWYQFGGYKARSESGIEGIFLSRPLIEGTVRARVKALKNISFMDNTEVEELEYQQNRISGIQLIHKASSLKETLKADLVVDASGRGSQTPKYLEQMGFMRPTESSVKINLTYTTRVYERNSSDVNGLKGLIIAGQAPKNKCAGVALAIENDRWIITLAGALGEAAEATEPGFLDFARKLPAPEIYNIINKAKPLSDFVVHKFPASQRRHYEKLTDFPEGLLVFGDAICSFNPIFGQGMSVAALEALELKKVLTETKSLDGLWKRFFKRAAKVVDIPWTIAVGEDLRYPEVEAKRSPAVNFINWYVGKVHQAAQKDAIVANAFHQVSNLLKPPPSLFAPRLMTRIIQTNRQRSAKPSQPSEAFGD